MSDLEQETQVNMFNTRVLKVEPIKLDLAGYHCLRNFFETINLVERKLKKISASYHSLVSGWAGGAFGYKLLPASLSHSLPPSFPLDR